MKRFEVLFYESENSECPVEDFISDLDIKIRVKWTVCLKFWKKRVIC